MFCVHAGVGAWCVLLLFFFFKQKTAYEMRISDWSSDVCSSDLGPGIVMAVADFAPAAAQAADEVQVPYWASISVDRARMRKGPSQIGRASCRERVCQYV